MGMLIIVILRSTLRPHIGDISSTSSGQGVMWLGNKGGVAIRFRLFYTIFTFVNSHLAAYDDQVERRNADHAELRRALRLLAPAVVPRPGDESAGPAPIHSSDLLDSDYVFWLVSRPELKTGLNTLRLTLKARVVSVVEGPTCRKARLMTLSVTQRLKLPDRPSRQRCSGIDRGGGGGRSGLQ